MPKPMKRLNWEIDQSRNWSSIYSSHKILEVTHALNGEKFVVNFVDISCFCNFWSIVGIPCHYAVATFQYARHKSKKFGHEYYSRKFYEVYYLHGVSTMNGQRL